MITIDQTKRLAQLARIELLPNEIEGFANQVGQILNNVQILNSIDFNELKSTDDTLPNNIFREDAAPLCNTVAKDILVQAPEARHDFFRVPRLS